MESDDEAVQRILLERAEWARRELEPYTTREAAEALPHLMIDLEERGGHLSAEQRHDLETMLQVELMRRQTNDFRNAIEAVRLGLGDVLQEIYDNTTDFVREAIDGREPDVKRITP